MCNGTDLGSLENGNVIFTNTTFDSVATYSCAPGYALDGDATRRCLADSTWSGTIPSCVCKLTDFNYLMTYMWSMSLESTTN